ncbi:MAG TPA: energy-coupling factor transporter ATPase [Limnochordales bacterium]
MSAPEPLIRIEGVRFRYGPSPAAPWVLDGVNLEVYPGEMVAWVGPNGSGKSTLARHLNGFLLPQEGRVVVAGMDTRDEGCLWAIRRTVGMVFQNPDNQLVAATVEEDVAFGPENLGLEPAEIARRVEQALEWVGMTPWRHHPPHQLSGGQKQRVAIAGVLAMRPACLVLDEPTSMLDPQGREEVLATLQSLRRQHGLAVVYITHRMGEAALCDRVVVLHEGRVALQGTPREVFRHGPQLLEWGLELPAAAQVAVELRRLGVPVPEDVLSPQELVEALCPSGSST